MDAASRRGLHDHADAPDRGRASASAASWSRPKDSSAWCQTVDPTMSLAILWTHPDFRVSAMSADGSAFGIV